MLELTTDFSDHHCLKKHEDSLLIPSRGHFVWRTRVDPPGTTKVSVQSEKLVLEPNWWAWSSGFNASSQSCSMVAKTFLCEIKVFRVRQTRLPTHFVCETLEARMSIWTEIPSIFSIWTNYWNGKSMNQQYLSRACFNRPVSQSCDTPLSRSVVEAALTTRTVSSFTEFLLSLTTPQSVCFCAAFLRPPAMESMKHVDASVTVV